MVGTMLQNPELRIEREFDNLLQTEEDCTPIEVPFLYRKNKRTRYNTAVNCKACTETVSGIKEGSIDCPYCLGTGTEWEQCIGKGWFAKNAFSTERSLITSIPDKMSDSAFFKLYLYTKKDVVLRDADVVLIPTLDLNGRIKMPLEIEGLFIVYEDFNFRSNQSQTEYYRYKLATTVESSFKGLIDD